VKQHSAKKGYADAAVTICGIPFDAPNPAAVAELEHAVRGMATDHVTPLPPFAVKCDNG
jgi:hypothetical protein